MDNQTVTLNKRRTAFISLGADAVIPEYKELQENGRPYVSYGKDNLYPNYLLKLYNKSPKNGSIIKNKAKYIVGKGFDLSALPDGLKKRLSSVNDYGESINKVLRKAAEDLEIYNGFYLEIIYTRGGEAQVSHIPYHKVRSDKNNETFYIVEDWSKRPSLEQLAKGKRPAFDPAGEKTGAQVFYFKQYSAGADTYTQPDYVQAVEYIEADILIAGHILTNARAGFTGSRMITFTDGEPETDEEKIKIERSLNQKFTGAKGSKLVIAFVNKPELAPKVEDLGTSDLTKEDFSKVEDIVSQNIYASHQITNPILFGIKTEGQLGGNTELRTAFDIFKNTYVNNKQEAIEEAFTPIFELFGAQEPKLVPVKPIGYDITEIAAYVPKGFLLDEIGVDREKYKDELSAPPPAPAPPPPVGKKEAQIGQASEISDDEAIAVFEAYGSPRSGYLSIKQRVIKYAGEAGADSELEDLTPALIAMAEFNNQEQKVISVLQQDKLATPQVIAEALGMTLDTVETILGDLEDRGLITVTDNADDEEERVLTDEGEKMLQEVKPNQRAAALRIMYSYVGPFDDRNRPFCRRILELDRLYTRGEIEQISARVGYSVWQRRGGFYHNPRTDVTTPYCRHRWQQEIVLSKGK